MTIETENQKDISFTPGLKVEDPLGAYWLHQVVIRLRRELYWSRVERGLISDEINQVLPLFIDKESQILAMSKFSDAKREFLISDPTALYLTSLIVEEPPFHSNDAVYGSFSWIKNKLNLNDLSCFTLALSLINSFDNAAGAIIASCLNDPMLTNPTISLIQKLWDSPGDVYDLIDLNQPLTRYGLVHFDNLEDNITDINWGSKISVPLLISNQLLYPNKPLVSGLDPITFVNNNSLDIDNIAIVTSKINANKEHSLKIVPIRFPLGGQPRFILYNISKSTKRKIVEYKGNPVSLLNQQYLKSIIVYCWLRNVDLYLDQKSAKLLSNDNSPLINTILLLEQIPIIIYLGISEKEQIKKIPNDLLHPLIDIPKISYEYRVIYWKEALNNPSILEETIYECAKRFRFEKDTIYSICEGLNQRKERITKEMIFNACRAEVSLEDIDFVEKVKPRFKDEKIILPHKQQLQFNEIVNAMSNLNKVHYDWQMAEVWNEGGITCLFTGPSGTGKTMAAEILSSKLDMPMYRIDLSQVINKYIGETEKNLKRIFDFTEISDTLLFFDEADALFGRRTEIKDAHDRYANITVSYLLERMERFKGLAILATNKKKNLDDAFTRRIRFIIVFPMPGFNERKRIWEQSLPKEIDTSDLDIDFLAKQFQISGGNIRSIVFNASLQSVGKKGNTTDKFKGKLSMIDIIKAVKREYDKMNRIISLDQFLHYANIVEKMEGS